jgi:hypothetical protein
MVDPQVASVGGRRAGRSRLAVPALCGAARGRAAPLLAARACNATFSGTRYSVAMTERQILLVFVLAALVDILVTGTVVVFIWRQL